jgi:FtsZ-binding cell division protein ZapB
MTIRIAKLETFFPRNGGAPVYQITEEEEHPNGTIIRLDPRNPSPEEMAGSEAKTIAQQQEIIAELKSEIAILKNHRACEEESHQTAQDTIQLMQQSIEAFKSEIDSLRSKKTALTGLVEAQEQRVKRLQLSIPWDIRVVSAAGLFARFDSVLTAEDWIVMYAAPTHSRLEAATRKLMEYKNSHLPIALDSDELSEILLSMLDAGVLTTDEVPPLLVDATRPEAYFPNT